MKTAILWQFYLKIFLMFNRFFFIEIWEYFLGGIFLFYLIDEFIY